MTKQPFTEHDLEHQRLKVQVDALQQLVLKLFVIEAKRRADPDDAESVRMLSRKLVQRSTSKLREFKPTEGLPDHDQILIGDEFDDVFTDIDSHLDRILVGEL